MFEYRNADVPQMLHIVITGAMTEAEERTYIADVEPRIHDLKRRYGYFLALVDVSAADHVTQERLGTFRTRARNLSTDRDRLAIVMASNLLKAAYKRQVPDQRTKAFVSAHAASTWLLANEVMPLSHRAA